jgi:hypothetical protein
LTITAFLQKVDLIMKTDNAAENMGCVYGNARAITPGRAITR